MMSFIQTLLAFFVVLGTLVVVHELGHFLVARWCGVKILRFSVGMGKVIWSRRFGADQTEWALSILPLGGYVKMLDAREQNVTGLPQADMAREFTRQPVGKRIAIAAAGPIANFLLAILIYSGLFYSGMPEPVAKLRVPASDSIAYQAGLRGNELVTAVNGEAVHLWADLQWKLLQLSLDRVSARLEVETLTAQGKQLATIRLPVERIDATKAEQNFMNELGLDLARPPAVMGQIGVDGAARRAGLQAGDLILEINSQPVRDALDFVEQIRAAPGKTLALHGQRGAQEFDVEVIPDITDSEGQSIGRIQVGINLAPTMVIDAKTPSVAMQKGLQRTWETSVLSLKMLGKMLVGEVSIKNLTGPIMIADYAGQTARAGLISFLSFIALISISLGVMNLLPIPVLDGGLLLYYALEVLTGRPIPERFGDMAQRAGIAVLIILMMVAVFNDLSRLFG